MAAKRLPSGKRRFMIGLSASSFLPNRLAMTSSPASSAPCSKRIPDKKVFCPSSSIQTLESGLTMISLTVSHKSRCSIGRKKGRISSKAQFQILLSINAGSKLICSCSNQVIATGRKSGFR